MNLLKTITVRKTQPKYKKFPITEQKRIMQYLVKKVYKTQVKRRHLLQDNHNEDHIADIVDGEGPNISPSQQEWTGQYNEHSVI